MDRGSWQATVYAVKKSQTWLSMCDDDDDDDIYKTKVNRTPNIISECNDQHIFKENGLFHIFYKNT